MAGEVTAPAPGETVHALQGESAVIGTVHDHLAPSAETLSCTEMLSRVMAAFRALPALHGSLNALAQEQSFRDLPQHEIIDRITAHAQEVPVIRDIIGSDRERLRAVVERAATMSPDAVRRFPVSPFVVVRRDAPEDQRHGIVESFLGRGGFGYVERVRWSNGRDLARKVFDPDQRNTNNLGKLRERFKTEYHVLQQLGDIVPRPEFAQNFDEQSDEPPSFTMEFLDGSSIAQVQATINVDAEKGVMRPERFLLLLYAGIAQSMSEVHTLHGAAREATADSVAFAGQSVHTITQEEPKKGLVHRDLKPQNVQLTSSGGIKILDFGMVHTDEERDQTMTATGDVLGTVLYMAPEVYDGGDNVKNASASSDVYALGVMLFEAMTGRHPFEHLRHSQMKLLRAHQEEFPDFDCIQHDALRGLLMRMLAKKPGARPTMAEAAHMLHAIYLEGAPDDERAMFSNFLQLPAGQRKVPLTPELHRSLGAAQAVTILQAGEPVGSAKRTVGHQRGATALAFPPSRSSIAGASLSFLREAHGTATYEVGKDGTPVRISPVQRRLRSIVHNRWVQSLTALAGVLGGAALLERAQTSSPRENGQEAPFVVTDDRAKSPKEDPLPRIPSVLRERTASEASRGAPAFGVVREGGAMKAVHLFGKVIDAENLYQLVPPADHPNHDMGISLAYLSDEDLAQDVFVLPEQQLQTKPPAQALVDVSQALRPQNKYGDVFQKRVAGGRECDIFDANGAYFVSVQGVCTIVKAAGAARPAIFSSAEFASFFSRWAQEAEVNTYQDPGQMSYEAYAAARDLQGMFPPDQMQSVSDERAFAHVPVGENSGVDARLRKLGRGRLPFMQDPTRVQRQHQQNQKSAAISMKASTSPSAPPPRSP